MSKPITRMSDKRLKCRYGESDGTDKVAEAELRRRRLSDTQIQEVIHRYRQGEYRPRGWKRDVPRVTPPEKQTPPAEATEPKAATEKVPMMHHGKFKGRPLMDLSDEYLAWVYASFSNGRKHFEKELRSRGRDDEDLEYFKKKYPYLGKSPKKQVPKDETTQNRNPSPTVPESGPSGRKKKPVNPVIRAANQYANSRAKSGSKRNKPKKKKLSAAELLRRKRTEALVRATLEKFRSEKKPNFDNPPSRDPPGPRE
jgi:hypothetical protein